MTEKKKTFEIELNKIVHLNETQARSKESDKDTVQRYFDAMDSGERFPPIEVCRSQEAEGWLVIDGHHRVLAAELLGRKTIEATTIYGDTRCDIRFALAQAAECNWNHGLPRTNADKRKAAEASLTLFHYLPDRQIARNLHISDALVSNVRAEMIATGKLTPKEDKTTKATKAVVDPANAGKSNREIAKSAGVDEKTVRNIRKKENSAPEPEPKSDPDNAALDAIALDASEFVKNRKRTKLNDEPAETPTDGQEDYEPQKRATIAKVTKETRRVIPDVEKASQPVVVTRQEEFREQWRNRREFLIGENEPLNDLFDKIVIALEDRPGLLYALSERIQEFLQKE